MFRGDTAWGFSNGNDQWSRVAFTDMDNSLGMGGRSIERTGANTWLMHLDYANLGFDDDDNDIVIQIRLATGGDPGQATKTVLTGKYHFSNFGALGGPRPTFGSAFGTATFGAKNQMSFQQRVNGPTQRAS